MLLIKPLFVIPIVIKSLNKKFFIHKNRNMKKITIAKSKKNSNQKNHTPQKTSLQNLKKQTLSLRQQLHQTAATLKKLKVVSSLNL